MAAREKSPTLRMYASGDKEPGAKKRSVLDRLEDSKFSQSSPPKVFCLNVSQFLNLYLPSGEQRSRDQAEKRNGRFYAKVVLVLFTLPVTAYTLLFL